MSSGEELKKEYDELLNQLSDPGLISDMDRFEELSRKKKWLEDLMEKQKEVNETRKQIEENQTILKGGEDQELATLAQAEFLSLREKESKLQKELDELKNKGSEKAAAKEKTSVLMEIRAGTGGDEAALFAGSLFRMYSKYSDLKGWHLKTLDSHPTDLGGFKEVIFEVKPSSRSKEEDVFGHLKYEGGVHRVQRIPKTEKSGRVHTSTATVAVLAKPKITEIKVNPGDLKISCYKASGPGGQYVQKTESAVRILHLPTGLVVTSQAERNQLQNKENAMAILSARLLEKKIEEENSKTAGKRNLQIGSAKRAEKIRTYNFSQDRVTDHRIKKSWHDIESIMEGELDDITKAFKKYEPE